MNILSFGACLVVTVAIAGCCTPADTRSSAPPPKVRSAWNSELRFLEAEIRSRTWMVGGETLRLVNYSIKKVKNRPDLVIAKYGVPVTGEVRSVDFYETRRPALGQEALLTLVAHDGRPGRVIAFEVVSENGKAFVRVTREFLHAETQKRMRISYTLEYMDDHRMASGIGEIVSASLDEH